MDIERPGHDPAGAGDGGATERAAAADGPPINAFIGADLIDPARPESGMRFVAGAHLAGRGDTLHGGVIPLLLDAAAYRALAPHLGPDEDAVSHDLHFSLVRSVRLGSTVDLVGRVVKRGRALAFLDAVATCDGEVVATARITKSIIRTGAWGASRDAAGSCDRGDQR